MTILTHNTRARNEDYGHFDYCIVYFNNLNTQLSRKCTAHYTAASHSMTIQKKIENLLRIMQEEINEKKLIVRGHTNRFFQLMWRSKL